MRFYLRVDHVVFRIHDVRLFFDFNKPDSILREQQWREVPYKNLATVRHNYITYHHSNKSHSCWLQSPNHC